MNWATPNNNDDLRVDYPTPGWADGMIVSSKINDYWKGPLQTTDDRRQTDSRFGTINYL